MPTDGETLKEEDEFIGFEYFIIKHTFQTILEAGGENYKAAGIVLDKYKSNELLNKYISRSVNH